MHAYRILILDAHWRQSVPAVHAQPIRARSGVTGRLEPINAVATKEASAAGGEARASLRRDESPMSRGEGASCLLLSEAASWDADRAAQIASQPAGQHGGWPVPGWSCAVASAVALHGTDAAQASGSVRHPRGQHHWTSSMSCPSTPVAQIFRRPWRGISSITMSPCASGSTTRPPRVTMRNAARSIPHSATRSGTRPGTRAIPCLPSIPTRMEPLSVRR
jgi:hypothetical protein